MTVELVFELPYTPADGGRFADIRSDIAANKSGDTPGLDTTELDTIVEGNRVTFVFPIGSENMSGTSKQALVDAMQNRFAEAELQ